MRSRYVWCTDEEERVAVGTGMMKEPRGSDGLIEPQAQLSGHTPWPSPDAYAARSSLHHRLEGDAIHVVVLDQVAYHDSQFAFVLTQPSSSTLATLLPQLFPRLVFS